MVGFVHIYMHYVPNHCWKKLNLPGSFIQALPMYVPNEANRCSRGLSRLSGLGC